MAFIELLDNEQIGFWKQPFVRAEEEIYMLFVKAQQNFAGVPVNGHGNGNGNPGQDMNSLGPAPIGQAVNGE